jgi:hypothetical protein
MIRQLVLSSVVVASAAGLSACGSNTSTSTAISPPPTPPESVDTAQVLALAQQTGNAYPFTVNAGAYTINDTSETTEPIAVNGM